MKISTTYHVWFATKRRAWLLQGDIERSVKSFIREVAQERNVQILECESAVNHVHILLRLDESQRLPDIMNQLKGRSSYRLHKAYPELKLDSGSEHFWQRGYGFREVKAGSLTTRRHYVKTQKERLAKFEEGAFRSRVL
jgi:putative transposase